MFLRLKYLFISSVQNTSAYRFLGSLSIHPHQFECRRKAKTNEAYQPQLFHWPDEKDDLYFSQQWEFFQHDFHHNNSTKSI